MGEEHVGHQQSETHKGKLYSHRSYYFTMRQRIRSNLCWQSLCSALLLFYLWVHYWHIVCRIHHYLFANVEDLLPPLLRKSFATFSLFHLLLASLHKHFESSVLEESPSSPSHSPSVLSHLQIQQANLSFTAAFEISLHTYKSDKNLPTRMLVTQSTSRSPCLYP